MIQSEHIRDQLLNHVQVLCEYQRLYLQPPKDRDRVVWWANTQDLNPGLGFFAELDRPYGRPGYQVQAAHIVSYSAAGESSIHVARSQHPAEFLDTCPVAKDFCNQFLRSTGRFGVGFAGITFAMQPRDIAPGCVPFNESKTSGDVAL